MQTQSVVTITPLTLEHHEALQQLRVRPEQEEFAVPNALTLAELLKANELPFVMLKDGRLVGFFFLDLDYSVQHDFCPEYGAGVRMVMVDQAYQRQGIATEALRQLPQWLKQFYPSVTELYLTVNCRNPSAYRCYEKCGYHDTGDLYLGGPVGPQHIMRCLIS